MEYSLRKTITTSENIKKYASLLANVFPNSPRFTPEFLTWQYDENPNGKVVGYDAFYENELAAHYVTIPVVYCINDKKRKGLLSLNTATHSNHRGKRLFTQLADLTYEEGKKQGYDFVIGVANQNSSHGFLKYLGFDLIATLEVKTGIGNIKPAIDDSTSLYPIWNEESLSWRLKNPAATYYKSKNRIVIPVFNGIMNAQLYSGTKEEISEIDGLAEKKSLGFMWIGLANSKKKKGLFINLPQKLKPSPLNLILKDLTENKSLPKITPQNAFFQLIDFDAY